LAGGTGTYQDPITFATAKVEIPPGTRIYIATIQKYFMMEDLCEQCTTDWQNGERHIDIWMGTDKVSPKAQALTHCAYAVTNSTAKILINPSSDMHVDTRPLWSESTGCICGGFDPYSCF
jgi:hypothetical protein